MRACWQPHREVLRGHCWWLGRTQTMRHNVSSLGQGESEGTQSSLNMWFVCSPQWPHHLPPNTLGTTSLAVLVDKEMRLPDLSSRKDLLSSCRNGVNKWPPAVSPQVSLSCHLAQGHALLGTASSGNWEGWKFIQAWPVWPDTGHSMPASRTPNLRHRCLNSSNLQSILPLCMPALAKQSYLSVCQPLPSDIPVFPLTYFDISMHPLAVYPGANSILNVSERLTLS